MTRKIEIIRFGGRWINNGLIKHEGWQRRGARALHAKNGLISFGKDWERLCVNEADKRYRTGLGGSAWLTFLPAPGVL